MPEKSAVLDTLRKDQTPATSLSVSSRRTPLYGWVIVVLAALAMVGTLPGRTHGLGMITERLLQDSTLGLDRARFGYINLWATLIGALFCFPAGWMLDRIGLRATSTIVLAGLGAVVVAMTKTVDPILFIVLITLTRGLGQSALSVVSISMTGKWFKSQLAVAMALYSILVSVGFMVAFGWGQSQKDLSWREQWQTLGYAVLCLAPVFLLLVRSAPKELSAGSEISSTNDENDFTFGQAITTPAFWLFALATSFYGLVSSGVSLFNQSLLAERGFPDAAYYEISKLSTFVGLAGNLLTGALAIRLSISVLACGSMVLLSGALLTFPYITSYPQLVAYASVMGYAGGMVTVVFFTVWARLYGRSHLGQIQSVAQMLTVFASALGPVVLAEVKTRTGSYLPAIISLGLIAAVLAIAVVLVPNPRRQAADVTPNDFEMATT